MLTTSVSQNQPRRNQLVEFQPLQVDSVQDLPDIPVLPKTLLLLELMVQQPCVDLREISHLVLADLGAALQILRLAGRVYGNAEGRPTRMEDCIADLGLEACMQAVSAQTLAHDSHLDAIAQLWDHSREIAQQCKYVAELMLRINPDEAYLTGLFHAICLLPELLEWRESGNACAALTGLRLATGWSLPFCVTEFFREIHFSGYPLMWSRIVREAHLRANRSSIDCSFDHAIGPHLVRNGYQQPDSATFR